MWLNASIRGGEIFAEDDELVRLLETYNRTIWNKPLKINKDILSRNATVVDRICYFYDDERTPRDDLMQYMFVCDAERFYEDNITARTRIR